MTRFSLRPIAKKATKSSPLKPAHKDAALPELIKDAAHELSNSVAIALGHTQLLKLKNKDETVAGGLNRIEKSLFKCGGIIKQIQEYAGQPNPETAPDISLPEVLKDTLETVASEKNRIKKRILIVDDDVEVRNVLNDMLLIEGCRAENCGDAYVAMKMLEKGNFNMIITDLGLPGMSGYDLAQHVHDKYSEIKIVLLTGWGNNLNKDVRKLSGVKAIISKPFHLNQVLDLVRN